MKTFLYNSVHYCEILLPFHTVRQNSDLVQKLCLGNLNIKIKIKWRNLHFCVLTTSYSGAKEVGSNLCLQPHASGAESLQSCRSARI